MDILIENPITISGQTWFTERVVIIDGRKVRAKIKRDAYHSQNHFTCDVWTGDEWSFVTSLPSGEGEGMPGLFADDSARVCAAEDMYEVLFDRARLILA